VRGTKARYADLPEEKRLKVAAEIVGEVLKNHRGWFATLNAGKLLRKKGYQPSVADYSVMISDIVRLGSFNLNGSRWVLYTLKKNGKTCVIICFRRIE